MSTDSPTPQSGGGRKFFYGWVIVFAGAVIFGTVMGIVYNCFSQFIKPVCDELGFSRQQMSLNQTINALTAMAVSLMWGKILPRVRLKRLMMIMAALGPAAYFCYSLASSIWMFYLISVFMSLTQSLLTMLPFSYLISNWFDERRGLATGIAFMGSGIGGMVLNTLLGGWLVSYGWRASFRILAVIMFLTAFPATLLIKERPEAMGLRPYGWKPGAKDTPSGELEGKTFAEARKTAAFWAILISGMMISMGSSTLVQALSPHLTDNGYSTRFAAAMVSITMGCLAVGKVILGHLFDAWGTKRAAVFADVCGLLGILGMIFCRFKPALVLICLGVCFACSYGSVGNPIVTRSLFGRKDYASIVGVLSACASIGGSIAPMVNGAVYDAFGSYRPSLWLWAAFDTIVFVIFTVFLPSRNKEAGK